ncbi:MAG: hypothetical protein E4H00_01000, partial [Myxococcales bacterium]
CYTETDGPCSRQTVGVATTLDALEDTVRSECRDGDGPLSVDALVARLQVSCEFETASIAARVFGGPHGAAWRGAHPTTAHDCMTVPHRVLTDLLDTTMSERNECLAGATCNASALELYERSSVDRAIADIVASCDYLSLIVALEPDEYVNRTMKQLDCLTAISHASSEPLRLSCGPDVVTRDPPPAPGANGYMKVVLDSDEYGTRCGGDAPHYPANNPYAFHIKLAPEGYPVENVLIYLEGGGACVFGEDVTAGCYSAYVADPSLFEAQNSAPHTFGIMSESPSVSPFANWTKVYVEYCTQDLHMGGGTTNHYDDVNFTVHRYGAINLRTALRYVRDLLWKELDARGGEGYRPDRIRALFGGFSAGGWGALYNYHWVLDDLQWPHTAAFPDSALALDNIHNGAWNLRFLAGTYVLDGPELYNWAAKKNQPPYCFGPPCVIGPTLLQAHAPRLKAVPEQQYMVLSNQNDEFGQMQTTFFDRATTFEQGRVNWINAARQAYCDTKDLNGVRYFLMPFPQTLHSTSMDDYYLTQVPVDGETMNSWLGSAFINPDGVVDRVEEGTLVATYPGVNPFPCNLP